MNSKKYFNMRWLFSCLIFFSCGSKNKIEYISKAEQQAFQQAKVRQEEWLAEHLMEIKNQISSGDLIVREGNDFTSQSLRQLNRKNKTYSHIGILSKENDSIIVYHIMGGEWNPDAIILRESLSKFVSPTINNQFAIYSLKVSDDDKKQIVKNAVKLKEDDVRFDMKFDLQTKDKMYCAEYVYHCVQPILRSTNIPTSQIDDFQFVGIDDIFLLPEATVLLTVNYLNLDLKTSK